MPSPTVELLRGAVSSCAYSDADRLLEVYRVEMEAKWRAANCPEARAAIETEVHELLEWARTATLATRAHSQRKLIYLTRRSAYAGVVGDPTFSV